MTCHNIEFNGCLGAVNISNIYRHTAAMPHHSGDKSKRPIRPIHGKMVKEHLFPSIIRNS